MDLGGGCDGEYHATAQVHPGVVTAGTIRRDESSTATALQSSVGKAGEATPTGVGYGARLDMG